MRVLAPATEDDMVLTFLRAEVDSPRFAGPLLLALGEQGLDRALVDRADRTDPEENAARRRLLATYRGYGRNEALFAGLPDDISWSWVALTPAELADVRYIDWDYWLEVSGGTRRPRDAIARMRADWDAEGSDYRRIAVSRRPRVPSPGARGSRTAARAGSGAAGRPRQIDRPAPRSSTSARRATRAARHVAANRGVGAVRVLREIP